MLAYVFFHWPQAAVAADYEAALVAFQRALAGEGSGGPGQGSGGATREAGEADAPSEAGAPAGFGGAGVFRAAGAPWLGPAARGYEDWYLVRDFAALGGLNDAAVAGRRQVPHDAAARLAAGGSGGVYALRSGLAPDGPAAWHGARVAHWVSKPAGWSYADFGARLRPWTARAGVSLWQRQLTLGPTTEFCLTAGAPLDLPDELKARVVERDVVWPR